MFRARFWLFSWFVLVMSAVTARGQKEYGFDNTKPSGQPYLTPQESLKRLQVPDGFEVKIAAAEPEVINPIAFTVDEKGRIWVVECYEYPKRTAAGKMPRDRIKVLESTRGDGVYDKVTIFAEGKDFPKPFDLASGIEVGHGGVFLGAPPYLWFLQDTDGDGKADRFEILLEGFGSQDTHETLNTFHWGPEGRLYGLHGVFTQSAVHPSQADGPATRLNAAMWRYDVKTRQFEIFAEGTSNPWGVDWRNSDGQAILACCVIPHLYHMVPGGVYRRQAGQSANPYAYGAIQQICDHTFHKESGWAHAGLISLDTPLMPPEYRDSVIFGSIHGTSLKQNVLRPKGSTFIASRADDFLRSGDKNFRPINLRWGPNGEIFVSDWHDKNPCHQAAAESWDYEHGRIYSIRTKGLKTSVPEDLGKRTFVDLLKVVDDPNPYRYRTALRLLSERQSLSPAEQETALKAPIVDPLRKLWALKCLGVEPSPLDVIKIENPAVRAFAVRFAAESAAAHNLEFAAPLSTFAERETSPAVRRELACAAIRLGDKQKTTQLLHGLLKHVEDAKDPAIPQLLWLAYERQLVNEGIGELSWLHEYAEGNSLLSDTILPRTFQRLAATERAENLFECLDFLKHTPTLRQKALEGLVSGLRGRRVSPPGNWSSTFAVLTKDPNGDVRSLAEELAVIFRDTAAIHRALATAADGRRKTEERCRAVSDLAVARPPEGKPILLRLVLSSGVSELQCEACRALAAYADADIAPAVLAAWDRFPIEVRLEAVNLLAGRRDWAKALLDAVGSKRVLRSDLNNNTILRMTALKDKELDSRIKAVWGNIRETPAELNALIDRMRGELAAAPGSFERGRKVFETQCSKCHKFEGSGHEVGPPLDGAGRDIEYLLINVLDPNRVVGAPYFMRLITMKNGRTETGLLAAEDDKTVTIKAENDALKVIAKSDIEELTVSQKSMMPEGLASAMTVQDFRDLVRYVMASPYLINAQVAGPFADKTKLAWDPSAPSEKENSEWKRPKVGVSGRIPLPTSKEPSKAYVATEVTAQAAMQTRLVINGVRTTRVWLNGTEIFAASDGDREKGEIGIDVSMPSGTNRVVMELRYAGDRTAIFARFLDPQRKLRYAELPLK
jgi:putative membrane-bound dehydrogenase-like protein